MAQLYAARARDQALSLDRAGRFDEARAVLRKTADRIRAYAGEDRLLLDLVHGLLSEEGQYGAHMAAMEMKAHYYNSSNLLRNRDPEGKARRRS